MATMQHFSMSFPKLNQNLVSYFVNDSEMSIHQHDDDQIPSCAICQQPINLLVFNRLFIINCQDQDQAVFQDSFDELMADKDLSVKTDCQHFFHSRCIIKWVNSKINCHLCRNRLLQKEKNLFCEKIRILESRVEFQHNQVQKMDNINRKLERDLEVTNQKLERQLYARSAVASILKQQSLAHQIENLKNQLACSQSLNEKYLEQIINSRKSQIVQLKSVNKSLYVKLDVLVKKLQDKNKTNKKENKEQKSKQFIELQSKYRKLLLDFKSFRQEHNEVLKKNLQYKKLQGKPRANILERDDSIVSLSYSMTSERASD